MSRLEIRQRPPAPAPDLAALLGQVAQGDHRAFELVYAELAAPVYGLVRQVLRDPAQSEEVAQEVLLEVWRTASRYDPDRGSAAAWALTIAHRRAVDRVQAENACARREQKAADPAAGEHDVAEVVAATLEHQRVRRCLDGLTELQRESVYQVWVISSSGGGPAAVASLAWRALPAWFCPPRHLHDGPARMRASLATALMSWSMLTGLCLVFAQLTQLQGLTVPGHPEIPWAYAVFDVALATSALAAGLGGLPLWLLMLRRARREHRPRDMVYLLLPVLAPVAYLGALIVTVRLAGGANGVSPGSFGVITLAGFAAAAIAAAGPGLALRRLQPRGPALRLAGPRPACRPGSWRWPRWPSWSP